MSRAALVLASTLLAASAQAVAASAVSPPASGPATASSAAAPVPFDTHSTVAAPCGTGTPPPGHDAPGLRPGAAGAAITVRQDGSRLCYVVDGVADAPVLHARPGETLSVTLRNEITDPAAIEDAMAPGKLQVANAAVPESAGFYKVVPGMHHAATGATNLHVHGFAVPPVAPQDDVLDVCTDPASGPVGCGQREFTYRWRIPAAMPEGLYWYHPHTHGEVQAQMLMGLTGAIVVEGPEHDARRAAGIVERVLVVRQTQDQDAGRAPAAAMTAAPASTGDAPARATHAPAADAIDTAHELLCTSNAGIDQISLNGAPVPVGDAPDAALAKLEIAAGTRQYWQLLNAATDAFLSLSLQDADGHAFPLQVAARDGSALTDDAGRRLPAQATTGPLSVPPGGRIELWVAAPSPGATLWLVTHAIDTGCAGDRLPERRLARVVAGPAASSPAYAPPRAEPRNLFAGVLARKVDRRRTIALAEYPRPGTADQIDFYIVERRPGAVMRPYRMGDAPAITVKAGTTEEWTIENWTNELHTFHIHQLHFRVLDIDGQPVAHPELLDVVEVPYASATGFHSKEGPVRPGRVRVRMTFPADMAGDIPFHCHLVDHEDNGMMAVLRILAPGARAPATKPASRRMQMDMPPG